MDHEQVQSAISDASDAELIGYFLTAVSEIGVRASDGSVQLWAVKLSDLYRVLGSAPLSTGLSVLKCANNLMPYQRSTGPASENII